jgi:hypothetical protein
MITPKILDLSMKKGNKDLLTSNACAKGENDF